MTAAEALNFLPKAKDAKASVEPSRETRPGWHSKEEVLQFIREVATAVDKEANGASDAVYVLSNGMKATLIPALDTRCRGESLTNPGWVPLLTVHQDGTLNTLPELRIYQTNPDGTKTTPEAVAARIKDLLTPPSLPNLTS